MYVKCPKNGCTTYTEFLTKHGWETYNLFENSFNLDEMFLWGHITDPEKRHTRGVAQYLKRNEDIDVNLHSKLLVSGVFDEHTYSLNMMLGDLIKKIHWIPLDINSKLTGDDLTNLFFSEYNLDLRITDADRRNVSTQRWVDTQNLIDEFKLKYNANYQKLVKNFLEPDILLYNKVCIEFKSKYNL
jgi:hypothetical protein